MSASFKFWVISAGVVALVGISLFSLKKTPELLVQNSTLKKENNRLKREIKSLKKLNLAFEAYLDEYENKILSLNGLDCDCSQIESILSFDLPGTLSQEPPGIRLIYRKMLREKQRWDQYHREQYEKILESTAEPQVIDSGGLNLENEENIKYFQELEAALRLHRRLIRDVRMFHDEIQYTKEWGAEPQYRFYDLKLKLSPFARESGMVDALQQAMSAMSAGIYQQEAAEVLDRLGEEFTKPILKLNGLFEDTTEGPVSIDYNYNFYIVFGKKLLEYSDTLARQSLIALAPSTLGELDFFNRRLSESLYDLYLLGQNETFASNHIDLNELEQVIYSTY
jgi:hypothetical protein